MKYFFRILFILLAITVFTESALSGYRNTAYITTSSTLIEAGSTMGLTGNMSFEFGESSDFNPGDKITVDLPLYYAFIARDFSYYPSITDPLGDSISTGGGIKFQIYANTGNQRITIDVVGSPGASLQVGPTNSSSIVITLAPFYIDVSNHTNHEVAVSPDTAADKFLFIPGRLVIANIKDIPPLPPRIYSAPTGITASFGTYSDKVRISWNAVPDATYYEISRLPYQFDQDRIITTSSTIFDDMTAPPGTRLEYYVCAGNERASGPWNSAMGLRTFPAPTQVSASDGSYDNKIRISWNYLSETPAPVYDIYRATSLFGEKAYIGYSIVTSFEDTSTMVGTKYYYWIKAKNGSYSSDFSSYDSGYLSFSSPSNIAASNGAYSEKIRITWNTVSEARRYNVYRSISTEGVKTFLGSATSTLYDDASAEPGVYYYYWVKALDVNSTSSDYSSYTNGFRQLLSPLDVSASDGLFTDKVNISWENVTGATKYHLYMSTSAQGRKSFLGTTTLTTFDDTAVTPGLIYFYWVQAASDSISSFYSSYDSGYLDDQSYTYNIPILKPEPDYWSGLGITNLSHTDTANFIVTIYNQSGDILTTNTKTIGANGQDSFLVGSNMASDGWIRVTSNQPLVGLNFLGEYEEGTTDYYLGDVPFTKTLSTSLLIPHVAQNTNWDTTVFFSNPNSMTASVTLTYTDKNGISLTPYLTSVPSNGSGEIPVSTITGSTSIKGGYVTIDSDQGLTAFALYNNLKTNNYSYAGINAVDISTISDALDYYLPVFKPDPKYWSGLGITNLSSSNNANVTVTVYGQNGTVSATESKALVAKGQDAFLVGTSVASDGWIKVSSDQALAGVNFLGEYESGSTDYYLGDVPFTKTLSTSLLIPHVAQNTTWDTTIFLANPNASTASVTLTYTDKGGTPSPSYTVSIPANGSKEIPVSTIGNSTSIKGGSVTISSTQGLTAFALYNNLKTNNYSYAGINAVDISGIE